MNANTPEAVEARTDAGATVHNSAEFKADYVVVGAGPAGQKAAVQAAKAGKSVVLIERDSAIGGE